MQCVYQINVLCAFSVAEMFTWGVPLSFTPLLRLKRCHACDPMACLVGWWPLFPVDAVHSTRTLQELDATVGAFSFDPATGKLIALQSPVYGALPSLAASSP
jgi:hypothetical protein